MVKFVTKGIAPKLAVACGAQATALVVAWIATGAFDRAELAQLGGLALTAVFGYIAGPGKVRPAPGTERRYDE